MQQSRLKFKVNSFRNPFTINFELLTLNHFADKFSSIVQLLKQLISDSRFSCRNTMLASLNLPNLFLSFRRTPNAEPPPSEALERDEQKTDSRRVRCPLCRWQPSAYSLWYCSDAGHPEYFFGGCGALFNTFETGGRCPGCRHLWRWTMCLRCAGWSPHGEWYD